MTEQTELLELLSEIEVVVNDFSFNFAKELNQAQEHIRLWISHFYECRKNDNAVELLNGTHSALLETSVFVLIGLGRPAIGSIRSQIDQLLAYSYFCEHPREWRKIISSGDGFMLRTDIMKYHKEMFHGFAERLGIVDAALKFSLQDMYRILSSHIHAQSPPTLPKNKKAKDLISTSEFLLSLIQLQKNVSLALSAYFVAVYGEDWQECPIEVVSDIKKFFTDKQRSSFFK